MELNEYLFVIFLTVFGRAQENINIEIQMEEEKPVSTIIGYLFDSIPPHYKNNISFEVENENFKIDEAGRIRISNVIDRENLCTNRTLCCVGVKCLLTFHVRALFPVRQVLANIVVNVNVLDVNDNKPEFSSSFPNILVKESAKVGELIALSPAEDADIDPANQVVSYNLLELTKTFELESSDLESLGLRLLRPLDRETIANYSATLEACDPKFCAKIDFIIEVEDEDDNIPQFSNNHFTEIISEDLAIGSIVLRLNATDADTEDRARIFYHFKKKIDDDLDKTFQLIATTGEIRLKKPLNAHLRTRYDFVVAARKTDSSHNIDSPNSTVAVSLIVEDVNNHAPVITIFPTDRSSNRSYIFHQENQSPSIIAEIRVTDHDLGDNAKTICKLGKDPDTNFILKGSSRIYTLETSRSFDYEIESSVTTQIVCRDYGNPPQQSELVVNLNIMDVNEFAPIFSRSIYSVEISENSGENVFVAKLVASDRDGKSDFSYTLSQVSPSNIRIVDENYENVNQHFKLDSRTGTLYTTGIKLDREIMDNIMLFATVTDSTTPPIFTATTQISITILDENDNIPIFIKPPNMISKAHSSGIYAFSVRENSPRFTSLNDSLEAYDPDSGGNGKLSFSLRSTWALKGGIISRAGTSLIDDFADIPGRQLVEQPIFEVFSNGSVQTLVELDRETVAAYLLNVDVRDNGEFPLASAAFLLVHVLDDNDNAPIWIFPTVSTRHINITSSHRPGTLVARLQAYDLDAGDAGTVKFMLLESSDQKVRRGHPTQDVLNVIVSSSSKIGIKEFGGYHDTKYDLNGYWSGPFYLNGSTGDLLVADILFPMSLSIRIRATDCDSSPLYEDTWIIINVQSDSNILLGLGGSGVLHLTIISSMIAITAIISAILIIAIVFVRHKPASCGNRTTVDIFNASNKLCCPRDFNSRLDEKAITANIRSSVILKDDSTESDHRLSQHDHASILSDKNERMISPILLNRCISVFDDPIHGFQGNIGKNVVPDSNSDSMFGANIPSRYLTDYNENFTSCLKMQTFDTNKRGQFSNVVNQPIQETWAPEGCCLKYEPPLDVDSGDSGRGPSEDGNQFFVMDNEQNGLIPYNYRYGSYAGQRLSSRPDYNRSVGLMCETHHYTSPRPCHLEPVPRRYMKNCSCYGILEDASFQNMQNERLWQPQSLHDNCYLDQNRLTGIPPPMSPITHNLISLAQQSPQRCQDRPCDRYCNVLLDDVARSSDYLPSLYDNDEISKISPIGRMSNGGTQNALIDGPNFSVHSQSKKSETFQEIVEDCANEPLKLNLR